MFQDGWMREGEKPQNFDTDFIGETSSAFTARKGEKQTQPVAAGPTITHGHSRRTAGSQEPNL